MLAACAAAAMLALAACGDDEGPQIPDGRSVALRDALRDVKERLQAGDCAGADEAMLAVDAQAAALPDDLDEDVRETVDDGVERLDELVAQECAGQEEEPEETDTEETVPEETIPTTPPETETEPPPTETEPPPEEEEPPPEEEEDPPPGQGGGGVPGPPGQDKKGNG